MLFMCVTWVMLKLLTFSWFSAWQCTSSITEVSRFQQRHIVLHFAKNKCKLCLLIKSQIDLFVWLLVIRQLSISLSKFGSPSVSPICSLSLFLSHVVGPRDPTGRETGKRFYFPPTLPTSVWQNKVWQKKNHIFLFGNVFVFSAVCFIGYILFMLIASQIKRNPQFLKIVQLHLSLLSSWMYFLSNWLLGQNAG